MRLVTVGTAMMRHPTFAEGEIRPDSPQPLFEEAEGLIQEAVRQGCDILCLPEAFAQGNRSQEAPETAEPPDGPITSFLSRKARERRIALITTVYLKRAGRISNAGVIYNKDGSLVGSYDKVHPAPGEREFCAPGSNLSVFEVEGALVGLQICYDLAFPEGCRCLALKGADIIFWPNMWGGMPEDYTDVIMRARAMENLTFVVSSAYVLTGRNFFREPRMYGRSCVIDWAGTVLAEVGRRAGVASATIDLDEARSIQLHRKDTFYDHRMPACYGAICQPRSTSARA